MKLESLALHHGYESEATTKAAAVPIYQTTSYTFDDTQHGADLFDLKVAGNIYTRIMNPTTSVLEQRLAAIEGCIGALAVASGMAAITYAIQALTQVGDNIVSTSQLYGGTYNLFAHTLPRQGVEVRMAAFDDFEGLDELIDDKTKALFCESIGNPAGNIVDLQRLAEIAHKHGVPLIVDNTVATPVLCRPFEHGADIVIHSLTKYIGGHGTTIGGVIIDSGKFDWVANKERFALLNQADPSYHGVVYTEAFGPAAFIGRCRVVPLRNTGAALSPHSAFLLLQGLETLSLRMERHCSNALALAEYLVLHPAVAEAAVVGFPHDIKGQGIYAYVTLIAEETPSDALHKELIAWVRKEIGPIAAPDHLQWAPGLPKTRSGKIMRRILRKIAENAPDQLGDTSTLADPSVVQSLVDERQVR